MTPTTHVPSNLDIHRTAAALIKQHGDRAQDEAEQYLTYCERAGATDGVATWKLVITAIIDQRMMEPEGGQAIH